MAAIARPDLSCHLITWGQDWERGLDETASLGYRACETFTQHALRFEHDVASFLDLLGRRGLRLSALYAGGRFGDPDHRQEVVEYNERVARLLAACGCDRIVFGPGVPPRGRKPDGTSGEELKEAARTINEAAQRCAALGVRACLHPHVGTEIETRRELDIVMELTDPKVVWLAPDCAHLARAGMDAAEVVRTYADRVAYVHLKDVSPDTGDTRTFPILERGDEALPVFCELGLGTVPLPAFVKTLREIGYQGWITVEMDVSTRTPIDSLRICRDYATTVLGLTL